MDREHSDERSDRNVDRLINEVQETVDRVDRLLEEASERRAARSSAQRVPGLHFIQDDDETFPYSVDSYGPPPRLEKMQEPGLEMSDYPRNVRPDSTTKHQFSTQVTPHSSSVPTHSSSLGGSKKTERTSAPQLDSDDDSEADVDEEQEESVDEEVSSAKKYFDRWQAEAKGPSEIERLMTKYLGKQSEQSKFGVRPSKSVVWADERRPCSGPDEYPRQLDLEERPMVDKDRRSSSLVAQESTGTSTSPLARAEHQTSSPHGNVEGRSLETSRRPSELISRLKSNMERSRQEDLPNVDLLEERPSNFVGRGRSELRETFSQEERYPTSEYTFGQSRSSASQSHGSRTNDIYPSREDWPSQIPMREESFIRGLRTGLNFAQSTPAYAFPPSTPSFPNATRDAMHQTADLYYTPPSHLSSGQTLDQERMGRGQNDSGYASAPNDQVTPSRTLYTNEGQHFSRPLTHSTPEERGAVADLPNRNGNLQDYRQWNGPTFHTPLFDSAGSQQLDIRSNQPISSIPPTLPSNLTDMNSQHPSGFQQNVPSVPTVQSTSGAYPMLSLPYVPPATEINSKNPTFNGKSNFQDFIVQFDCVAQIKKWSLTIKGERLLMALEGMATSILSTLSAQERTNYVVLRAALEKRFNPSLDADLAGNAAQARRRKKGESYVVFAQELKRLMNTAYENWPTDQIERLTRERFFNAIEDTQLKGLLWSRSPRSVEEAAVMADGLENLIESTAERSSRQNVYLSHQGHKATKGNQEIAIRSPSRATESSGRNSFSHENNGHKRNIRPTARIQQIPRRQESEVNLSPPSHGQARRPQAGQRQYAPHPQDRRGRYDDRRTSDICYYCQKPGHWSKFCLLNPNRVQDDFNRGSRGSGDRRTNERSEN